MSVPHDSAHQVVRIGVSLGGNRLSRGNLAADGRFARVEPQPRPRAYVHGPQAFEVAIDQAFGNQQRRLFSGGKSGALI